MTESVKWVDGSPTALSTRQFDAVVTKGKMAICTGFTLQPSSRGFARSRCYSLSIGQVAAITVCCYPLCKAGIAALAIAGDR